MLRPGDDRTQGDGNELDQLMVNHVLNLRVVSRVSQLILRWNVEKGAVARLNRKRFLQAGWGLLLVVALACGGETSSPNGPPVMVSSTSVDLSTAAERVVEAGGFLGNELPSPILDAQWVEVKIGDDWLGPADYRLYLRLKVDPAEVENWRYQLTQAKEAAKPPSPPEIGSWPGPSSGERLTFLTGLSILGRQTLVAASDTTPGVIYIWAFST